MLQYLMCSASSCTRDEPQEAKHGSKVAMKQNAGQRYCSVGPTLSKIDINMHDSINTC